MCSFEYPPNIRRSSCFCGGGGSGVGGDGGGWVGLGGEGVVDQVRSIPFDSILPTDCSILGQRRNFEQIIIQKFPFELVRE